MKRLTERKDEENLSILCNNCPENEGCIGTEDGNEDIYTVACISVLASRLAEYEDMEEQGLLLKKPCKVGDRMYFLDTCHTAEDFGKKFVSWGEVTKVSMAGMYVCLKTPTGLPLALSWESIFTTREAAEKALEEI